MPIRAHDPVSSPDDDLLSRSLFVEHLERALIHKCADCGLMRSTGAVVSLEGIWGSGKSSIINLVGNRLEQNDNCIVIRFAPWFVQSGDHLIRYFFDLLTKSLEPEFTRRDDLIEDLLAYARLATYGADISLPGSGGVTRGLLDFVGHRIRRNPDIFSIKERIETTLESRCINFVCLIDEVDRLSEDEIRETARLIRAIGDFQRISYLVGFDERRVSEALGQGDAKAGHDYLQKIISLRIPMPASLTSEAIIILRNQLIRAENEGLLPEHYLDHDRFRLLENNISNTQATPRTIIRTLEKFIVIRRMIGDNVDWIDALGFVFLEEFISSTCNFIRNNPEEYVVNPIFKNEYDFLIENSDAKLARIRGDLNYDSLSEPVKNILKELFPVISDARNLKETEDESYRDRIKYRQSLLCVLRLGLLPNAIDVNEINNIVQSEKELTELLISVFISNDGDKIDQIMDFIKRKGDHVVVRRATVVALNKNEKHLGMSSETSGIGDIVSREFASDKNLSEILATTLLYELMPNNWCQVSRILRTYIFMNGLYRWEDRSYGTPNIGPSETMNLVKHYFDFIRKNGSISYILEHATSSHAFWIIIDYLEGDHSVILDEFKKAIQEQVLFENFLKLCFGPGYMTDFSSVSKLISKEEVENLIHLWALTDTTDPHLKIAVHGVKERWIDQKY